MRLRKIKGARETLESRNKLVILEPALHYGKWQAVFGNGNPIHLELGMGKGQFIANMSLRNPEINYIGIDLREELLIHGLRKWDELNEEKNRRNLILALMNIEHITEAFAPGEVERIYLNFSDPWPKKRHERRRLTAPEFLSRYKQILKRPGQIYQKTDNEPFFEYSLNSLADEGFRLRNISLDLHNSRWNEGNIMTEYETKFAGQGMKIFRCEALLD